MNTDSYESISGMIESIDDEPMPPPVPAEGVSHDTTGTVDLAEIARAEGRMTDRGLPRPPESVLAIPETRPVPAAVPVAAALAVPLAVESEGRAATARRKHPKRSGGRPSLNESHPPEASPRRARPSLAGAHSADEVRGRASIPRAMPHAADGAAPTAHRIRPSVPAVIDSHRGALDSPASPRHPATAAETTAALPAIRDSLPASMPPQYTERERLELEVLRWQVRRIRGERRPWHPRFWSIVIRTFSPVLLIAVVTIGGFALLQQRALDLVAQRDASWNQLLTSLGSENAATRRLAVLSVPAFVNWEAPWFVSPSLDTLGEPRARPFRDVGVQALLHLLEALVPPTTLDAATGAATAPAQLDSGLSRAIVEALRRSETRGVDVGKIRLARLELAGARLRGMVIPAADFRAATLESADFSDSMLEKAEFGDGKLEHADFSRARLHRTNFERADLRDAKFVGADLDAAVFESAELMGADFGQAGLKVANLQNTNLSGANLVGANLKDARLQGANLQLARLQEADLSSANLADAILSDANLSGADLTGANLEGANMSGTTLDDAILERIKSNAATKWPVGFAPR